MLNSYLQHDESERVQELTMKETVDTLTTMGTYFWGPHAVTFGGQYKQEEFVNGQNVLFNDGIPGGVKKADRWIEGGPGDPSSPPASHQRLELFIPAVATRASSRPTR